VEGLLQGEAVRERYAGAHHELGGFFEGAARSGLEAVPLFAAYAMPAGAIARGVPALLWSLLEAALEGAAPLDGLLVAAHGAAVSEAYPDLDGWWLSRLRARVGCEVPIVCVLDSHANVSEQMIRACDATIAYRTNPHVDQRARGVEAAGLLAWTLQGEVRPTQAVARPPLVINIERQHTETEPCRTLETRAEAVRAQPHVLSASVVLGFPYADVKELGASFIVVTDGDAPLAQRLAADFSADLWRDRERFVGELISIDQAIRICHEAPKPACLLDMGDNVGGGSPGDGTFLAHALRRENLRTFVCLFDPQAAAEAAAIGVGGRGHLPMGGKTDDLHGPSLHADVVVKSLHSGTFKEEKPRHGGQTTYQMGVTAVVEASPTLTVMLTSRRVAPYSLGQLYACGLDPLSFDVLVTKGVHGPVAAYTSVCPTLLRVDTPGVTTADLSKLTYTSRRRPLYPFEGRSFS